MRISKNISLTMTFIFYIVSFSDDEPPVCPNDRRVNTTLGADFAYVNFSVGLLDNVDRNPDIVCSPGPEYSVGTTNVSCYAFDSSGNSQSCSLSLTVLGKYY